MSAYDRLYNTFVSATAGKSTSQKFQRDVKYTDVDPNASGFDAKAELVKYFKAADQNGNNDGNLQASEIAKALGITPRAAQRMMTYLVDDPSTSIHVTAEMFAKKYYPKLDKDRNGVITVNEKETLLQSYSYYEVNVKYADEQARKMMSLPSDQRRAADIHYTDYRSYIDRNDIFDGLTQAEALADATNYLTEAATLDRTDGTLSTTAFARSTGLSTGVIAYLAKQYPALDLSKPEEAAQVLVALDEQDGRDGVIGSDRKKWLEQKAADAGNKNTYATTKAKSKKSSKACNNGLGGILTLAALFFGGKALLSSFKKNKSQQQPAVYPAA